MSCERVFDINLQALARQLGYPYAEIAPAGPFGNLGNALLSDFPITQSALWTAALLSGDAKANDLTRYHRSGGQMPVFWRTPQTGQQQFTLQDKFLGQTVIQRYEQLFVGQQFLDPRSPLD